jgi:hypothetical protein
MIKIHINKSHLIGTDGDDSFDVDYYITEFTARLLENGGRYQAQYLIPMNLPRLTPDTVDVIFDTYKTDLRCD